MQSQRAIDVGSRKQLFVDSLFIEACEGVHHCMNPPWQTGEELLVADRPWESGMRLGSYNSIVYDESYDGPRFRLWYDIYSEKDVAEFRAVAYAESEDGVHFEKPVLNLVEWNGSRQNNFVIPDDLSFMTVGGGSVALDENPACPPGERYKSWSKGYGRFKGALAGPHQVWYSPDGLRWKRYEKPVTGLREADTQSTWFWDADTGRYAGYTREWVRFGPGKHDKTRMASYNESDDMLTWENTQIVLRTDELDPGGSLEALVRRYEEALRRDLGQAGRDSAAAAAAAAEAAAAAAAAAGDIAVTGGRPMDIYGPGVFKYAEADRVYIALFSAYYHWREDGPHTADVQLAVSRNGRRFQRLGDRRPFLRLGPSGSFYSKWIWACPKPVRVKDELWFYYLGSNVDHSGRPDPEAKAPRHAISRAIMRLDGFVSLDARYAGGYVTTPALLFTGDELRLNVDTSAGGTVRVELQDERGAPIPGYSLADADELNGNSVRMPVSWRGGNRSVAHLSGRPVKLHFSMRDCKLYAFQFVRASD